MFSSSQGDLSTQVFTQGSDFFTIYVRPTTSPLARTEGEPHVSHDRGRLPEELRFAKFCYISWTHDNKGFFYQVNDPIQNVIRVPSPPPYLLPSRGTQSVFRMETSHRTRLEPKLPATSMPSCITIELALHSVSLSRLLLIALCNLRLDSRVQLTTFWYSRIQNTRTGCGPSPFPNSTVVTSKCSSAKTRLECVNRAPSYYWLSTHLYLFLFFMQKYLLWVADLKASKIGSNLKWVKLIDEFDASYDVSVPFILWGFLDYER